MNNIEHTKKMLREYNSIVNRINYLERIKDSKVTRYSNDENSYRRTIYSCSGDVINKLKVAKQDELVDILIAKTKVLETDLEKLRYTKETMDLALKAQKKQMNMGIK